MEENIAGLRKKIDDIDDNIIRLIFERQKAAESIGALKKKDGIAVLDKKREERIFEKIRQKAKDYGLEKEFLQSLFEMIIRESRRIQR